MNFHNKESIKGLILHI